MNLSKFFIGCTVILFPFLSPAQDVVKDSIHPATDSLAKDSLAATVKVDTVKVVIDTVVKKDCYAEYYDLMRTRGAKPVPDGMQQVVIALKGTGAANCFLGQVEVVGGKIKPPLYFQAEDGQYRAVSITGKKLESAFATSMTVDELYTIKDGMSIVFRTSDQEYGRLFFYQFINRGGNANKMAPPPHELIKE
jgi:hypothetical protein